MIRIIVILVLYATAALAVPLPPKRPTDLDALIQQSTPQNYYCPIPENVKKQYCTKSKEVEDKVAKENK